MCLISVLVGPYHGSWIADDGQRQITIMSIDCGLYSDLYIYIHIYMIMYIYLYIYIYLDHITIY